MRWVEKTTLIPTQIQDLPSNREILLSFLAVIFNWIVQLNFWSLARKRLKNRFETLEGETSIKKIREIVAEVLCDEGLQLNLLDDRVDNLEELAKKYLNAELQAVV